MTATKIDTFGGLAPRYSRRLLPDNAATVARNTKLLSGELRGFHEPREIAEFDDNFTVRKAYRIPYGVGDSFAPDASDIWLRFDTRDVDIVRSPIVNDQYNRYYWAGDGAPKYSTLANIAYDEDPLLLGIPTPTVAPTLTPPAPVGDATDDTRAYVYTWVSAYGEEGAPSPAVLGTGQPGTWALTNLGTGADVPDAADRNITRKRIYRTVAGNASTVFFFVADIDVNTTSYNDDAANDIIASNNTLESTSFIPPPEDMEGFVVMPNGYLVGWAGRRLLFSEPYRPHAWPAEYEQSVEFEIVGLAVFSNTLVICTKSKPALGQGATPAAFTMQKMDAVEPCLSRRGIVSTIAGVYYPSLDGLAMVNNSGITIVTQGILKKEEWVTRYTPQNIYAAQLDMQYVAFVRPSFGFIFNPTEPNTMLVELDRFDKVDGVETDLYSGNVYLVRDNRALLWDEESTKPIYWTWRSKEFQYKKPINMGAYKIKFDTSDQDISTDILDYYGGYNTGRFALGPLAPIGGDGEIGGVYVVPVPGWFEAQIRNPIGGGPLFPLDQMLINVASVRINVYANGVLKYAKSIFNEKIHRLPAGFKTDIWQFELVSNVNVYSLQVAETGKELETI